MILARELNYHDQNHKPKRRNIMRQHIFLSSVLTVLFFSSFVLAQETDPEKEQKKAQNQERIQVKENEKNQQKSQIKNQNRTGSKKQQGFVDANGDGFNDNAPDADGDGIPNGRDEDYTGSKMRNGNGKGGFVDNDGDGINDNAPDADGDGIPNGQDADYERPQDGSGQKHMYGKNSQQRQGRGNRGPGDGTGNAGIGPQDGTGNGSTSGDCDGTGPKGNRNKRGGKN